MARNIARDGFACRTERFFGSRWYPPFIMLLIFLAHTMAWELPVLGVLVALVGLGAAVSHDLRFLLPPLLGGVCMISLAHTPYLPTESDYFFKAESLAVLLSLGALLLCFLVIFLIRNAKGTSPFSSLRLKWGFLGFFAAMALSGLGQENALKNLLYGVGVGASFLLIYLLFGLYHPKTKQNAEHFLYTLTCIGLLVLAELLVVYLTVVEYDGWIPLKESVLVGWGTWTHAGAMAAICIGAPFYFARGARRPLPYLFAGGAVTLALLLSASRAAWLYGLLVLAAALLLCCLGGKNRRALRITIAALILLAAVAVVLLLPKILAFLSVFIKLGVGDNGRFELWRKAIDAFLAAPVFGRGFFNSDVVLSFPPIMPYLYHNTPLQMLGAAGGVGLLLYGLHRAGTLRLAWKRRHSPLSLFLLLTPLALVLTSLTDEHIFHIYPAFYYAVALSLAEGRYEDGPVLEK
ncbi:MAG: O-antigen ligase family protein [Clostridia bacterium]|nr:O-antigen ligase family protein [Clostridia bacterium]